VLVAEHLLKLGAHLVTALTRLLVHNPTLRRCLEAGSKREKKGGEEQRNARNSEWQFGTKNAGGVRACVPIGKVKWFYNSNLSSFGHRSKHAGCGRVRSRNICFGHVPVAVRQGLHRDAVARGEERLGRCAAGKSTYIRFYRPSGKLALAPMHL
jgi:hypothetical protein